MAAFGIKAIQPQDNEHIFGFATARGTADMALLEVWNGPTQSDLRFTIDKEGQLQTRDGTLARPTYSFETDKDSGRYLSGAASMLDVISGAAVGTWTAGKLALAGDLEVGDDVTLISDAAVLNFGVNSDVSLTHVHDTGLLLNSTMAIQFNDASQYINAPSATVLDINAADEIELNATAVDLNGTLDVSGAATLATSLNIAGSGATVTGILDEDNMSSDSAVKLATQQSIKAYVDSTVGGADLDFAGGSGTGSVDLDSQTFTVAGTSNEIETSASSQTITIGLPDDVTIGDDLTLGSDGALLKFGGDGEVTLTHVHDTGLLLNSTMALQFGDSGSYIQQSGDGVLRINGEATVDIYASTMVAISNDLRLNSDAAVLAFGANSEVTLTHVHDTGLLLNGAMALQFSDASQYINAPSATVLDINATDEIELNATAVDLNGTLDVSGAATLATSLNIASDGATVTGIKDEDNMSSNSATKLATQQSIKAYVDAQITAEDLDVAGDSGTGAIDLDSQSLTIAGTANEIVTSASGQTITIALPDDVTIGDDLTITDNLTFSSDSAVVTFGADSDTTLTHTDGVGLTLNSTNKITFGDVASFIHQSGDGVLRIDGEATIDLNASTKVDVSAALDVGTDLDVGDDLTLSSDGAILGFGSPANVTLTHVHDTGLLLNSTNQLQFYDASQYINAPSATALGINATDEIELNATLADVNANLDVSGTIVGASTISGTTITASTAFVPDASDGASLGTTSLEFSDLYLADGAVIRFGDDQDVSLTHVADTGLLLSDDDQLQFGDSGTYIHQSANGVLDLVSDTEVEINATTIDMNGALDVSGTALVTGVLTTTATQVATGGITSGSDIISDTDSTDSLGSTGTRWLKGWFDTLTAGTLTIGSGSVTDSSGAISFGNENLTTTGIVTAAGTSVFTNLDISGDVDVDGTTNLDVVDIDGAVDMASTLQVDGASTFSSNVSITVADNSATLQLISTDADASAGPLILLDRDTANQADGDAMGRIYSQGRNNADELVTYSQITTKAIDVTDGTEDGEMLFNIMVNGASTTVLDLYGPSTQMTTTTFDLNGALDVSGTSLLTGAVTTGADITIPATNKIYLDGGSNTYITESAADTVSMFSQGAERYIFGGQANPYLRIQAADEGIGAIQYYEDDGGSGQVLKFQAGVRGADNNYYISTNATIHSDYAIMCSARDVTVGGDIAAASKSFRIDHPLTDMADTHTLTHACIEGPRADLIYRSSVALSGGTASVDLDESAGISDGTWEALCRDPQVYLQNDTGWSALKGSISGSTLIISCENTNSTDTVSWMVVAERDDPTYHASRITDDDGVLILEAEKPEEDE